MSHFQPQGRVLFDFCRLRRPLAHSIGCQSKGSAGREEKQNGVRLFLTQCCARGFAVREKEKYCGKIDFQPGETISNRKCNSGRVAVM